jgi:hypothetical protein
MISTSDGDAQEVINARGARVAFSVHPTRINIKMGAIEIPHLVPVYISNTGFMDFIYYRVFRGEHNISVTGLVSVLRWKDPKSLPTQSCPLERANIVA